jgi:hypothetical protein
MDTKDEGSGLPETPDQRAERRPDRRLPKRRGKQPPAVVAKPPPEAAPRVDGGGPWGPTPFDLPDPEGNQSSIVLAVIAAVAVLIALTGFLTWFYFYIT